jgi:hypothetical protein
MIGKELQPNIGGRGFVLNENAWAGRLLALARILPSGRAQETARVLPTGDTREAVRRAAIQAHEAGQLALNPPENY